MVSNAQDKPVVAKVEIEGQPQIKFKPGNREYIFNTYYIERPDYPKNQDTVYYLKITAAGYPTKRIPMSAASIEAVMFKPGDTYVYEGYFNVPVYYDNRYLACIIQNGDSTRLVNFCKTYNMKICSRFNYCGGTWKGRDEDEDLKPNTFIIKRNNGVAFAQVDTVLQAFRDSFPHGGGTFYCRGIQKADFEKNGPFGVLLIYNSNQVEVYMSPGRNDKVTDCIKKTKGATFKNFKDIPGIGSSYNGMQIYLPTSWNIEKVNKFIDGLMPLGILGAQAIGISALNCPD